MNIYIKWIDSSALHGWWALEDIERDLSPAVIETVGVLLGETDELFYISAAVDMTNNRVLSPFVIPKCAVLFCERTGAEEDRQDAQAPLDGGSLPPGSTSEDAA